MPVKINKIFSFLKTKNTAKSDGVFSVDPAGLAPAPLLTKGNLLLHKIRTRIHEAILKQKKPFGKDLFCGKQLARILYESCLYNPIISPPRTMSIAIHTNVDNK